MGSPITTHILDTSLGRPAQGVAVVLERYEGDGFVKIGEGVTDDDGRLGDLLDESARQAGVYNISFDTGAYFAEAERECFYPSVSIVFEITAPDEHHHVPLLLNPFGYSTYRGS